MKNKIVSALILILIIIVQPTLTVFADAKISFITINKTQYMPLENIVLNISNADEIIGKKYLEIIDTDSNDIVLREFIVDTTKSNIIAAPSYNGNFSIKVYIGNDVHSRSFDVKGATHSSKLSGSLLIGKSNEVIGINLNWTHIGNSKYKVIRNEYGSEPVVYENIEVNHFIDVNLQPNKTYEYMVYNDDGSTNSVFIDIIEIKPSEYLGSNLKGVIELYIGDPCIFVNGLEKEIYPNEKITPLIKENRVITPIRAIVEAMGGIVEWDEYSSTVTLKAWDNTIEIPIEDKNININGVNKKFDVAATLINSRTFVPIRLIEELGCSVDWISETKLVLIKYKLN